MGSFLTLSLGSCPVSKNPNFAAKEITSELTESGSYRVVGRIKTHCGHFYLCPVIHPIGSILGTTRAPPLLTFS
jgi:hypothetical protein